MLPIIVFELAVLIGVGGSLSKNPGLQTFGWVATTAFIVWGIATWATASSSMPPLMR
jgi:hypothetical protein